MSKTKVAVIFGGVSGEHEVSLAAAANILLNIPSDKYEAVAIGITRKGRWLYYPGDPKLLTTGEWESHPDCTPAVLSPDPIHRGFLLLDGSSSIKKVDVIFPVLFGQAGNDGSVQGLFELSGIPYVGCDVFSSVGCMDKELAHTILEANGIATARWCCVTESDLRRLDEVCDFLEAEIGYPMFVKPARSGSSIGVSKAYDREGLAEAVKFAFAHGKKVIVEEFIDGRELECAVFGNDNPIASPVGEVTYDSDFYSYEAKYVLGTTKLIVPAQIDDTSEKNIRELSVSAFRALGCSGLARADFYLKKDGGIILGEVNTMPSLTSTAMYTRLMNELGMSFPELIDKLISLAFDRADVTSA